MIVATLVTVLGLLTVGVLSQLYGFRLGGTIAIPVLAVYTLKNVLMLPIFVLSTAVAYLALQLAKDNSLVYGRDELLIAMGVGSLIPLGLLVGLASVLPASLRSVVFIGSILPGLAAFNYHQLKPGFRARDAAVSTVLFVGLFVLGWLLISPGLRPLLGTATPPALYAPTADIAVIKGAAVAAVPEPTIFERPAAIGLFALGTVVSERVRSRYGLRIGLMAMALLAVYALANTWLLVLYALTLVVAYVFLEALHRVTMLYGRVTISLTTAVAAFVVVPLVLSAVPIVWLSRTVESPVLALLLVPVVGFAVYSLLSLLTGAVELDELFDILESAPAPVSERAAAVRARVDAVVVATSLGEHSLAAVASKVVPSRFRQEETEDTDMLNPWATAGAASAHETESLTTRQLLVLSLVVLVVSTLCLFVVVSVGGA